MRAVRAILFGDTPHRVAGAQKSLLAAVTRAREVGLDPVMVFPDGGGAVEAARKAGIDVRILEGSRAFKTFGKALLALGPADTAKVVVGELLPYARRLAQLVERERADVVHFNTARGQIMAGLGAHLAGRPSVLHVRGVPALGPAPWAVAQALSDRFVLVAHALVPYLAPASRPRARVVYNGVTVPSEADTKGGRTALRQLGLEVKDGEVVVVALSSLVPFKGLHHLVRAARALADRGVVARFVLAGRGLDDEYEAWLRRLPGELGVADRVSFAGFVEAVPALLASADALVLPSVERERLEIAGHTLEVAGNEGLPRSVLEAMAAGLPVVATDIAGVREQVVAGETGLVVPPGDPAALADALERVVRDEGFRRAAGAAAREVVRSRFTLEAAGRGLVEVLHDAKASPRSHVARLSDATRVMVDVLGPPLTSSRSRRCPASSS